MSRDVAREKADAKEEETDEGRLSPPRVLVCDLDETLIATASDPSYFDYRPPDFTCGGVLFFKRPHVDALCLNYQNLHFHTTLQFC